MDYAAPQREHTDAWTTRKHDRHTHSPSTHTKRHAQAQRLTGYAREHFSTLKRYSSKVLWLTGTQEQRGRENAGEQERATYQHTAMAGRLFVN